MGKENNNSEFEALINKSVKHSKYIHNLSGFTKHNNDRKIVQKKLINAFHLKGDAISNFKINEASFFECQFKSVTFYYFKFSKVNFTNCVFENCIFAFGNFLNSEFSNTKFITCEINNTEINGFEFNNISISNSNLFKTTLRSGLFLNSSIHKTYITDVIFHTFGEDSYGNSSITSSTFIDSQLINSDLSYIKIEECDLSNTIFANCNISEITLKNFSNSANTCFIDLQTILKSNLKKEDLTLFGIHNDEAKDFIKSMVTEIKFQSVFISYSFKNKEFARQINDKLRSLGVNTFLWELHAPGGKRLRHIMYENIQKHDRLLFIASIESLKSEACHYELKEARDIQDKEWKDIYFPIHIDDYLFTVRKEDIPRKYREDYWENIEEVKDFHSKDFSKYKTEDYFKSPEFEEDVKNLIKDLKL